MLKQNPKLFYLAIIVIVVALLKNYFTNKVETAIKPRDNQYAQKPDRVIQLNAGDISQSIQNISNYIDDTKNLKNENSIKSMISYFIDPVSKNKVYLCDNYYTFDTHVFSETGDLIYENKKLNTKELKNYPQFYKFLTNVLALTSPNEKVEIFLLNGLDLPNFFIKNPNNTEGSFLIKLSSIKSNDNSYIMQNNVTLQADATIFGSVKRKDSQYKCSQSLEVGYIIKNSKGDVIFENLQNLTLGKANMIFEKVLEYIILNSTQKNFEAEFKSYLFDQTIQDQNLTIIGTIKKISK
jgi:hypothetical protein